MGKNITLRVNTADDADREKLESLIVNKLLCTAGVLEVEVC